MITTYPNAWIWKLNKLNALFRNWSIFLIVKYMRFLESYHVGEVWTPVPLEPQSTPRSCLQYVMVIWEGRLFIVLSWSWRFHGFSCRNLLWGTPPSPALFHSFFPSLWFQMQLVSRLQIRSGNCIWCVEVRC